MATVICGGDVLLMNNGDMGIVRDVFESNRTRSCTVELKQRNSLIELPLNDDRKQSFKKLSGEQLFDKLLLLHDIISQDHIHINKMVKLQKMTKSIRNKIKSKEEELNQIRTQIKTNKRYLLLQQSIWTITHPKNIDKTSMPILLLTYPTFTTAMELFENIKNRFFHLNADDIEQRLDSNQWDIQVKVISLLQNWMRTYWIEDFYFDSKLVAAIYQFANDINHHYGQSTKHSRLSSMLKQTAYYLQQQERQRSSREMSKKNSFFMMIQEMKEGFQELDNKRIAQQMTLIDFDNFVAIKPRECLNKNWLNEELKDELSPNIVWMIESLNATFQFVCVTILLSPTLEKRGRLIKKFLKICKELKKLNNFHSLSAVFGALRSTPIWKLRDAWNLVPKKHINFYNELIGLFDTKQNMGNLRAAHKKAQAPMVPYTGIFLTELVGIEEKKKDSKAKKAINFDKLVSISQSIDRVLIFQKTAYNKIKIDVPMQNFLKNQIYEDIHQMGTIDEEYLFNFSKTAAKQDAEDSKNRMHGYSNSLKGLLHFGKVS